MIDIDPTKALILAAVAAMAVLAWPQITSLFAGLDMFRAARLRRKIDSAAALFKLNEEAQQINDQKYTEACKTLSEMLVDSRGSSDERPT